LVAALTTVSTEVVASEDHPEVLVEEASALDDEVDLEETQFRPSQRPQQMLSPGPCQNPQSWKTCPGCKILYHAGDVENENDA